VQYEDRLTITTPEGVTISLALAGLASRFIAAMIDHLIQLALIASAVGLSLAIASGAAAVTVAALISFAVTFGYDVLFETLASGRTPGKRFTTLRVVTVAGGPVTFRVSAVRNLLRAVDFLPAAYVVGATAVLVSGRNQRLGDLAAGTLVIRVPGASAISARQPTRDEDAAGWDVSAVTAEELAAVRRFLERRPTMTPEARRHLAAQIAARLVPKVAGMPSDLDPEPFLERLAAEKAARA
jgi:uncharacterized RDD family membrane protein YckC